MQVNFSRDEYAILCELADRLGTKPAWLAHEWVMERAGLELYVLKAAKERRGTWDCSASSPPIPSSDAITEQ